MLAFDQTNTAERKGKAMLHIYYGEGKGKTTAAAGLAVRAMGHGQKVCFVQFLKSGTSGELAVLRQGGALVLSGKAGTKFVPQMTEEEKKETARIHDRFLEHAKNGDWDLLVLDEACAAVNAGLIDEEMLRGVVLDNRISKEIVITGRNPRPWMLEAADYLTEMKCVRHPYELGVPAREGVEF